MTHEEKWVQKGQEDTKIKRLTLSFKEEEEEEDKRLSSRGGGGAPRPQDINRHNAWNNLATNMAAQSPQHDSDSASSDYSLFMSENGHISFENPNYQLDPRRMAAIDPARLDDHLNSNIQPSIPVSMFEELKHELDKFESTSNDGLGESSSRASRKVYAAMDSNSMGVDISQGPKTALDNKIVEEKMQESYETLDRFIQDSAVSTAELSREAEIESDKLRECGKEKADKSDGETDEREEEEKQEEAAAAADGRKNRESAATGDSSATSLLSSTSPSQAVVRRRQKKKSQQQHQSQQSVSLSSSENFVGGGDGLPPGWEKHEDDDGAYYWHVKSGTIQREPPASHSKKHEEEERSAVVRDVRSSRIFDEDFDPLAGAAAAVAAVSPSTGCGTSCNSSRNMRNPHVSMSKSCTSNSIVDIGKENRANNGDGKDCRSGGDWKRRSMPAQGGKSSGSCDEDQLGNNKAIQVRGNATK